MLNSILNSFRNPNPIMPRVEPNIIIKPKPMKTAKETKPVELESQTEQHLGDLFKKLYEEQIELTREKELKYIVSIGQDPNHPPVLDAPHPPSVQQTNHILVPKVDFKPFENVGEPPINQIRDRLCHAMYTVLIRLRAQKRLDHLKKTSLLSSKEASVTYASKPVRSTLLNAPPPIVCLPQWNYKLEAIPFESYHTTRSISIHVIVF